MNKYEIINSIGIALLAFSYIAHHYLRYVLDKYDKELLKTYYGFPSRLYWDVLVGKLGTSQSIEVRRFSNISRMLAMAFWIYFVSLTMQNLF